MTARVSISPYAPDDSLEAARLAVLRHLALRGYRFTTPAPSTHRRVLWRRGRRLAGDLADALGWNMPFSANGPLADLVPLMQAAGMIEQCRGRLRSTLRVASLGHLLFLHSAFPPRDKHAVFFGPDSYRFAAFIRAQAPALEPGAAILDIGAGAGVGGIVAHGLTPQARLVLTDVNRQALALAKINAAFAGQSPRLIAGGGLAGVDGLFDLILANPPYLGDSGKTYSDGGGHLGAGLSVDWTRQALGRLKPRGRFLLYTAAPFVGGVDQLKPSLERISQQAGCALAYEEIDPDVFPSTLLRRPYWKVERIAAVGAVMTSLAPEPARNLERTG